MRRISGPFLFAGLLMGCCIFTYTSPRDASHAKSIMPPASRTASSLHRHSQTPIPTDMEVEPNITPAVTLDLSCTDYDCLQTCMEHLPELVGYLDPGVPLDTDVVQGSNRDIPEIGIYEIAVYLVKGGDFKRTYTPVVPERLQKFQDDIALHKKLWDYVVEIVPESVLSLLTNFAVYTDRQDVKSTMQASYSPPYQSLRVDLFDLGGTSSMTQSLIHETGHFITINTSQIKYMVSSWGSGFNALNDLESFRRAQKDCSYIYDYGHCAAPGSYLDLFYIKFWKERHNYEAYLIGRTADHGKDTSQLTEQLLKDYPDEFLSSYAATNVNEDIAVSFERFVLGPKPFDDSIAHQKVLFFYEFPELVVFRQQVIQNICDYAATH
jgi:hypothetical protein